MIARPKVFRWVDALTHGLAAVVATVLAVLVQLHDNPLAGKVVTWVVAVGFWFVYAMLLRWRRDVFGSIDYVTNHGLYVVARGYPVKRAEVEAITEHVLDRWETVSEWPGVRRSVERLFVFWEAYPFEHHKRPGFKWAGFRSELDRGIIVGYRDPLATTALAHELGHQVFGSWRGTHTDAEFTEYAGLHDLPR
jgi:hypothetical protein